MFGIIATVRRSGLRLSTRVKERRCAPAGPKVDGWRSARPHARHQDSLSWSLGAPRFPALDAANRSAAVNAAVIRPFGTSVRIADSKDLEVWLMGEVIVKYKVNLDEKGQSRIDSLVVDIEGLPEDVGSVQRVEKKPLAFGMMFVEVQVVIEDGEGHLDRFEDAISDLGGVTNLETLELGRL